MEYDNKSCDDQYKPKDNMYETILGECDLDILAERIEKAGLVETIATTDPITVFGPVDRAFRKLSKEDPVNLPYHVVPEYLPSKKLENDSLLPTLSEGDEVRVNVYEHPNFKNIITVNGAKVLEADIRATNGILHKINKVLVPPTGNVVQLAQATPDLSILVQAVVKTGLVDILSNTQNLTVFAPTNQAFLNLVEEIGITIEELLESPLLGDILLYHLLSLEIGTVFTAALRKCLKGVPTGLESKTLRLEKKRKCHREKVRVIDAVEEKAKVLIPDVLATNGVVHVINKVLLPVSL